MVEFAHMATRGRQPSARPHLTPGDVEAKASPDYYIAANHGARRVPVNEAYQAEASQLQDAELDLRFNSKFDRVFGNAAFEGENEASPSPKTPGAIKMNNLFEDPHTQGRANPSPATRGRRTPDREVTPDKAGRGPSMTRHWQQPPQQLQTPNGTMVEAFNPYEEEHQGPRVVARAARPVTAGRAVPDKSVAAWEAELKQLLGSNQREEAVYRPAPSSGLIKCYVKRVKNFFGTHCSFQMHLENGDIFLLAARRRKKSKTSSYIISQDLDDLRRDTENCLAKLKANFVGTEYILWGKSEDRHMRKGYAREQLCINFKSTALTASGGPRQMFVGTPAPDSDWQPTGGEGPESLSVSLEAAKAKELPPYMERRMALMTTKTPEWDESLRAYTLDFRGRVKEASVKNFQLAMWDHNTDRKGPELILQFGKVEDDVYALDFMYPLSVEVAFAIALASIDTKLCYTL